MHIDDHELKREIFLRDPDRKYVHSFDEVFKTSDCKIKLTPVRSPNLQAHVERVIQTIKHEVLNAFCIVTNEHLDDILRVTQSWYNLRRGDSARDHLPPVRDDELPMTIDMKLTRIESHTELGGLLNSYRVVGDTGLVLD